MPEHKRTAMALLLTALLMPQPALVAAEKEDPPPTVEYVMRAPFPLGAEALQLMPGKRNFYLFGSLENHAFDGIHILRANRKSTITRYGEPVRRYPDEVVFRITATTASPEMPMDPPSEVDYAQDESQLLLGLRFALRVFRGLDQQVLRPREVRLIGIPTDQPSDERVYRISFKLNNVPADARLALDVMTPNGDRMARFRVELI